MKNWLWSSSSGLTINKWPSQDLNPRPVILNAKFICWPPHRKPSVDMTKSRRAHEALQASSALPPHHLARDKPQDTCFSGWRNTNSFSITDTMKCAFIQKNIWSDNLYFHRAREQIPISMLLSAFKKEFHKGNGDSYFIRGIWEVILSKESRNLTRNRQATGRSPPWLLLCLRSAPQALNNCV